MPFEVKQYTLRLQTRGRGTYDITREVNLQVGNSGIQLGTAHIFTHHTSCSLMLCENADPSVRRDLEVFMGDLVPDGDRRFEHQDEGPDDMPAHIRTMLTNPDLTVPVSMWKCALGTWQGIYLWEHRSSPHLRRITVTIMGAAPNDDA